MSRRLCSLVLCGLVCLVTGLAKNLHGGDSQPTDIVSEPIPDEIGSAGTPPMMPDAATGQSNPDPRGMNEPQGFSADGRRQPAIAPPGTLGRTYTQLSHAIPLDHHPRTAMLAVKDNRKVKYLTVGTMGGIRMKNGIWLFESTRPLDPGACQIVRVEARETPQDVEPYATRLVRLIPGRILYLEF